MPLISGQRWRHYLSLLNRDRVAEYMVNIHNGIVVRKGKLPPRSQLLNRALHAAFPDYAAKATKREIVSGVKKRGKQIVGRGKSRAGKELTGEEKAIREAEAFYEDRGFSVPKGADTQL